MRLNRSVLFYAILSLPLAAQEISNDGMFVSAAGYTQSGRFEWIDGIVPNSGGVVRGPTGEVSLSLNDVFSNFSLGVVLGPIDFDGARVSLKCLLSGELYIELDQEGWELVFTRAILDNQWDLVSGDSLFVPDGKGWRVAKDNVSGPLFVRARLK